MEFTGRWVRIEVRTFERLVNAAMNHHIQRVRHVVPALPEQMISDWLDDLEAARTRPFPSAEPGDLLVKLARAEFWSFTVQGWRELGVIERVNQDYIDPIDGEPVNQVGVRGGACWAHGVYSGPRCPSCIAGNPPDIEVSVAAGVARAEQIMDDMAAREDAVLLGRDQQPFRIELQDEDGDVCRHFVKDGPVEIWVLAGPGRANTATENVDAGDMKFMVEVLTFPNYEIARQHADALGLVTRLLQNAIDEAREHAADPIPTRDDGHRHVVRFARYARALPWVAMCEICMHELVPDVAKWARDRGLIPNEGVSAAAIDIHARRGTVIAAIEQAFNRDPGLVNG